MDYRYFPDPDLPPLILDQIFLDERKIVELPIDRRLKYKDEYKLIEDDSRILSNDRITSDFYEELVQLTGDPKKSCSYITTILFAIFEAHHEKIDLSHVRS
jgi:aspartyl-tRNA(Asn)/glutamyl-tRNA(Gln) amidotransferase subunit B